jgi:hypothetical protein
MTIVYPDQAQYSLAPGWNNTAGYQVLQGFQPMGVRKPFQGFIGFGLYNPGTLRVLSTGSYFSGYESVQWIFSYLDYDQFLALSSTYCNGGYSGQVTAKVTAKDQLTTENWNAILLLPKDVDLRAFRPGWDSVALTLSKRGIAS